MTQTHNFKVGDKVLDKSDGDVGIVIDRHDCGKVWAKWGSTGEELWFNPHNENYELVQQPKSPTTNKPHKHKDLIIAWANGAEIEFFDDLSRRWYYTDRPVWGDHTQYRIKPEAKPDVVKYMGLETSERNGENTWLSDELSVVQNWKHTIKLTFCGETGKLKAAEVIS